MMGAGFALIIAIIPDSQGIVLIPDVDHLLELLEIDLILVIIGVTLMVGVARTTGLFDYTAIVVLKKSGNNQYKLLFALCILTLIFSALLDAYMAILLIGSITIVGCEALNINPKPFFNSRSSSICDYNSFSCSDDRICSRCCICSLNDLYGCLFSTCFISSSFWLRFDDCLSRI